MKHKIGKLKSSNQKLKSLYLIIRIIIFMSSTNISISLEKETLVDIDKIRGDVKRSTFIQKAIKKAISKEIKL